jgi:cytosine/adenosine deaminase-related metal-dependent hydrolase
MAVSLQARIVFPVDQPPIEHGVVKIDGGRIVSVDSHRPGQAVLDLGDVALLPGLVNAHAHLEFSHLQQPLGQTGMPLVDWIRLVIDERGRGHSAEAIAAGIRESVSAGVTTIGEIATARVEDYQPLAGFHLTLLQEVIGFSRARAASALAASEQRLEHAASTSGNIQLGLSPHAPYTVSPELLRQLVDLARRRNLPVAMHLAESTDELKFLATGIGPFQELLEERSMWDNAAVPRGSRPLDYLQMLAEAPRALVVHGNYLAADECAFLAAHAERMSLVYCPRTHAYFQHSPYPLAELLAAGVRVALGTDSRASNPDLDLWAEMRHAALAHPRVSPQTILRMGTLLGSEALGRDSQTGSISAGKWADLVSVPVPGDATGNIDDLLLAAFASSAGLCAIWLRGQQIHPAEGP